MRYEDLRGERRDRHLAAMLRFLGAPAGAEVVREMWRAVDFDALREREQSKEGETAGFFRAGRTDSWREIAPDSAVESLAAAAARPTAALGYLPER